MDLMCCQNALTIVLVPYSHMNPEQQTIAKDCMKKTTGCLQCDKISR